ncbi:MAG TPA: hypothetical protein VFH78_15665 [Candidatus Thermoplasmatota archaeon]|nr:hypothetical protein [Candidatus Thermoplasmatota archaeon]
MPETELTGEKIVIEAFQTSGDATILLGYTSGDVNVEISQDVIEAEVHDSPRKLRKAGKVATDVTFGGVVTTTLPALAMLNLATGTNPQTIKPSGPALNKVVVKIYANADDASPDATLTLNNCIPMLEGITIPGGTDVARFNLRLLVNGDMTWG